METINLNVGDTVYECGNYGVYRKLEVIRVTPKRAYLLGNIKIDREISTDGSNYEISPLCKSTSGLSWYKLPTPDLDIKWFRKNAIEKLKSFNFDKCSHETLVELIKLLPENKPS